MFKIKSNNNCYITYSYKGRFIFNGSFTKDSILISILNYRDYPYIASGIKITKIRKKINLL